MDSNVYITYLFFMDDILIFSNGSRIEILLIQSILDIFVAAIDMVINIEKISISLLNINEEEIVWIFSQLHYPVVDVDESLSYFGFVFKSNSYLKRDWAWFLEKVEIRIHLCCNKLWLSRDGRLILVKIVLEATPVYWVSLSFIPGGILNQIRQIV